MRELIFYVEEAQQGGYTANSLTYSIFTQGETLEELKANITDAIHCHFDDEEMPKIVRLHLVHQEVFAIE